MIELIGAKVHLESEPRIAAPVACCWRILRRRMAEDMRMFSERDVENEAKLACPTVLGLRHPTLVGALELIVLNIGR